MSPAYDWRQMMGTPKRQRWQGMTREQQGEAIRDMARAGHDDNAVAEASGLSVDRVRQALAEREGGP